MLDYAKTFGAQASANPAQIFAILMPYSNLAEYKLGKPAYNFNYIEDKKKQFFEVNKEY